MNITIPKALKDRMDAVPEKVNWSAAASAAYKWQLDVIESIKEVKTMPEVIERLRASKRKYEAGAFQLGKELGIEWAKTTAEYPELENLYELNESYEDELDTTIIAVSAMQMPPDDLDYSHIKDFWERVGAKQHFLKNEEYLQGFLEGATDVFAEVADQI